MTQKRELKIYRNLLISLHTAVWTGNNERVRFILDKIGEYSYARTNGWQDEKFEKKIEESTLLELEKL